jgi:Zn-dependent peptidase ImmA (M78 family)/DNA-binding XRE family transcriptional regulator
MVNAKRIALARKRRGQTLTSLSAAVDITTRQLNRIETGDCQPSPETLTALARELRFPESFFEQKDPPQVQTKTVSFRALSKMTAARRDAALGAAEVAIELAEFIGSRFDLPLPDVPGLRGMSTPDLAADHLRALWGLGEKPIRNVVHLLESHGVRVFSLVEDCDAVDAFSFRSDDVPYVFLNTRKSAERSRFDACHELGHLVLHGHAEQGGREAEIEADRFASAFLMPRASVLAHVPPLITLDRLIEMKKVWKVSVGALIQRLHSLEVLTEWKHRALWMEASQRGYRKQEPESIGWESSQILGKVLAALAADGISRRDLARQLHLPTAELDALVFGLTMARVE